MADNGDTVFAYTDPANTGAAVKVGRRTAQGTYSTPQTVYTETVKWAYLGVRLKANATGDATVNFRGGTRQVLNLEWVRCSSGQSCAAPVVSGGKPSWQDHTATMAVAPGSDTIVV
ncbi:MAG: hypothetical protein ACR2KG_07970 [Nocardioidaceae bacterium]